MSYYLSHIDNFPSATLSEELAQEAYACVLTSINDSQFADRYFADRHFSNTYIKLKDPDKDCKKLYNYMNYITKGIEQVLHKNKLITENEKSYIDELSIGAEEIK